MRLTLKTIGHVESVREVHWARLDQKLQISKVSLLVGIRDLAFAQRHELRRDDSVDLVAFETSHGLGLCDGNDIAICEYVRYLMLMHLIGGMNIPKRSLIMPRIPDTLVTRVPPVSSPSFSLSSPEGRSMMSPGTFGEDGEVKA